MTYRSNKERNRMTEKLIERKNQIEKEIFIIECADKLSRKEREKLNQLNNELLNVRYQIEKEKRTT